MARTIGIDLGTTNSVMATIEGGEPTVIPNAEGERLTPSVVAVTPNGERLVGRFARRQAVTNPENTVFSIKRFMGRKFDDPAVQRDKGLVPYQLRAAKNGDVEVKMGDRWYSPQEISAMILQKLKTDAEAYLGEKVDKAVVTVPAYFDNAQRDATKDAGRIAGLDVQRIINEPTASALAYGLDKKGDEQISVYDLGGGTYDISVLNLADGVFQVQATNGDTHLGGDDFDQTVIDYLADEFKKQEGIDLRKDRMALQRLKEAAEKAKIELSSVEQTDVNLPFITADASGPKHLNITLTRAKLEQLTQPLVDRTVPPMDAALKDAGQSKSDIDEVILVGGQTRMPAVQRKVQSFFGKEPHKGHQPGRGRRPRRGHPGRRPRRRGQGHPAPRRHAADALHRDAGRRGHPAHRAQHDDPDAQEPDLHHGLGQPAAGGDQRPAGRAADGDRQQEPRQVHPGWHPAGAARQCRRSTSPSTSTPTASST